ncbi:hypothetical protein [Rhizobium phage RHEph12]|nr:hypothetical protein [Rhizobium phage RHEph12]
MSHRSYPTPANADNDVGSNHEDERLRLSNLKMLGGEDLMQLRDIAYFWGYEHGRRELNKPWAPIYKRINDLIISRLDKAAEDFRGTPPTAKVGNIDAMKDDLFWQLRRFNNPSDSDCADIVQTIEKMIMLHVGKPLYVQTDRPKRKS